MTGAKHFSRLRSAPVSAEAAAGMMMQGGRPVDTVAAGDTITVVGNLARFNYWRIQNEANESSSLE